MVFQLRYFVLLLSTCWFLSIEGSSSAQGTTGTPEHLIQLLEGNGKKLEHTDSLFTTLKQNNFGAALNYATKGYQLAIEAGNSREIVKWQRRMGLLNKLMGNYNASIQHYMAALKKNEETGDSLRIRKSYNDLGSLYHFMEDYEQALHYFFKSLKLGKPQPDDQISINARINIGHIYRLQKKYDEALTYYLQSQQFSFEHGREENAYNIYGDLGKLFHAQGAYEKALEAHLKSLGYRKKTGNKYGLSGSFIEIGALYQAMGMSEKAIQYSKKGLSLARELKNKEHAKEAHWTLYQAYSETGELKEAINNLAFYTALNDSLLNKEKVKQITELEFKYSVKQKEKEIELLTKEKEVQELKLQQKNYLLYGVVLMLVVLALLAVFFFRQKQFELKQQSMEMQQKLLRSQMNPHFIFNSLIAIQSFIYKKKLSGASKFLATFSKLVRLILENSREELISFHKEIATLTHYLEMQKLRFTDDFEYEITVDRKINQEVIKVPPMLAQPFIENAIEHGLKRTTAKGKINIQFMLNDPFLLIEIEDNGIGFYQGQLIKKKGDKDHKSLALEITRERIALFNQKSAVKIEFSMEELKSEKGEVTGTKVIFNIPLKMLN